MKPMLKVLTAEGLPKCVRHSIKAEKYMIKFHGEQYLSLWRYS